MASSSSGMPDSQDDDSSLLQNYSMNGKIIISALGLLFFIIFILAVMHMYSRWCWRRSNMRLRALSHLRSSLPSFQETSKAIGLNKEIVKALPIFTYRPQLFKRTNSGANGAVECAVCLADFRQNESCKLLPKCKHFFHTGCIDTWLLSHATCPLCRATPAVLPVNEEASYPQCHATTHVDREFGEQGQAAQTMLGCAHGGGNDTTCGDGEQELGEDHISRNVNNHISLNVNASSQPQDWRQSCSDKFTCIPREVMLSHSASVLCRGNDVQIAAVAERPLTHVASDNLIHEERPL